MSLIVKVFWDFSQYFLAISLSYISIFCYKYMGQKRLLQAA